MAAEVLSNNRSLDSSVDTEDDYDDDNVPNDTVADLTGTSLLDTVRSKRESTQSFMSDTTYNFRRSSDFNGIDEFEEDSTPFEASSSPSETSPEVPAEQSNGVPPPSKITDNDPVKSSPPQTVRKTNPSSARPPATTEQSWFQKLTAKKETPEEREKRLRDEAIIEKQVPSRWGKDILEEDSDEDEGGEIQETESSDKDESATAEHVKSLITKSFGSALVAHSKDENGTSSDEKEQEQEPGPSRANRWALMGGAAITSVRNVQRRVWGGEEIKTSESIDNPDKISEGDNEGGSDEDSEGEGGDKLSEIQEDFNNSRNAMWRNRGAAVFTSVRNAWGGADSSRKELENGDESSSHADDSKSIQSESDNQNNLLSSFGNFLQHTRARFDPEVWADPEIQESLAAIEKLRKKLHECRTEHRSETRRREQQIENSISQQKNFLARKLRRLTYNYSRDPFHKCIKQVYEKEILIIVHEATSIAGDDDSQLEKDGIDDLLDSKNFDFDHKLDEEEEKTNSEGLLGFFAKNDSSVKDDPSVSEMSMRSVNRDSLVPLETRLIRAQHNEWMTDHQMECARSFQQKSVEHLYDLLPELRKDHENLKKIPQSSMDAKIKELEASNKALKEAYQAHVEAQEKLLAIYRERYVPSVHEAEEGDEKEDDDSIEVDGLKDPNSNPWAKNLLGSARGLSVRGLFGSKKDENGDEEGNEKEGEEGDEKEDEENNAATAPTRNRRGVLVKNLTNSVRGLAARGLSVRERFGSKKDENVVEEGNEKDGSMSDKKDDDELPLSSPISGGSLSKNKFVLSFGSPSGASNGSGIVSNFSDIKPPLTTKDDVSETVQESAKNSAAAAWTVPKMDKGSLPERLAEKRAKRAAARKASRPDAVVSGSSAKKTTNSTTMSSPMSSPTTSRSELLRRARKARQESTAAIGSSASSEIPSARSDLKSPSGSRKELSMKDIMASAGDSRRRPSENDSRTERLSQKKNHLDSLSDLATRAAEARKRVDLRRHDDSLSSISSQHSLHERPRSRSGSGKNAAVLEDENENEDPVSEDNLQDVDEFGA